MRTDARMQTDLSGREPVARTLEQTVVVVVVRTHVRTDSCTRTNADKMIADGQTQNRWTDKRTHARTDECGGTDARKNANKCARTTTTTTVNKDGRIQNAHGHNMFAGRLYANKKMIAGRLCGRRMRTETLKRNACANACADTLVRHV